VRKLARKRSSDAPPKTTSLTPREIVAELDKYIVGQHDAKRAVAIAIRNRWRRQQLPAELAAEVSPKNIMMIGPTGVGKTEIARRLAKLTGAPFLKIEATKYTEVGYYGRDVESMIRDLVENAIGLVRDREREKVREEARRKTEEKLLDLLDRRLSSSSRDGDRTDSDIRDLPLSELRRKLEGKELEDRMVEITVETKATPVMVGGVGMEHMDLDLQGMFEKILPKHTSKREITVKDAREIIYEQEAEGMLDQEKVNSTAIELAENLGIIFLDEIDKIVASDGKGADVSRQGVQRDLLPIVEGTTIQTRYGYIRTDHILFVAAGAFHRAKPSDLMPELQGRFPIRVELKDLTKDDFLRILREPQHSLTRQYSELLGVEKLKIEFTDDALESLASYAHRVNQTTQNIGARRLYTIMERLLEELSFDAPDMKTKKVTIDAAYVNQRLEEVAEDEDLSKYIL
jgi:ATP-dependent HslUV protease ATP-binding subunit HslU